MSPYSYNLHVPHSMVQVDISTEEEKRGGGGEADASNTDRNCDFQTWFCMSCTQGFLRQLDVDGGRENRKRTYAVL